MILFVDTSNMYLTVAIYEGEKLLISFYEKMLMKLSDEGLFIIDELFKKIKRNINDIKEIIVVTGPGSFTGIRIGTTFGKVLSYALDIPIKEVSSLRVMSLGYSDVGTLIDARRGNVFGGLYKEGEIIFEGLISTEEFLKKTNSETALVSNDEFSFKTLKYFPDFEKIRELINTLDYSSNLNLSPRYMKLSEAEEKKKWKIL